MAEESGDSEPRTAENPRLLLARLQVAVCTTIQNSSAEKQCGSRRRRATFKSPCPELVCQKFYLHFLFKGFLNKRNPLFSSFQPLSHVQVFETSWSAARQVSLSITNSRSLFKLIESVMPCNHLILCHPLLLQPSVFPSIRVLSNESGVCIWWPKYWSFSFNISPSNIQD